jgi:hypothetical protein
MKMFWITIVLTTVIYFIFPEREDSDSSWKPLEIKRKKRLWERTKPSKRKVLAKKFKHLFSYLSFREYKK